MACLSYLDLSFERKALRITISKTCMVDDLGASYGGLSFICVKHVFLFKQGFQDYIFQFIS